MYEGDNSEVVATRGRPSMVAINGDLRGGQVGYGRRGAEATAAVTSPPSPALHTAALTYFIPLSKVKSFRVLAPPSLQSVCQSYLVCSPGLLLPPLSTASFLTSQIQTQGQASGGMPMR